MSVRVDLYLADYVKLALDHGFVIRRSGCAHFVVRNSVDGRSATIGAAFHNRPIGRPLVFRVRKQLAAIGVVLP